MARVAAQLRTTDMTMPAEYSDPGIGGEFMGHKFHNRSLCESASLPGCQVSIATHDNR